MISTVFLFLLEQLITIFGTLFVFRYWLQRQRIQPPFAIAKLIAQLTSPWVDFCRAILFLQRWRAANVSLVSVIIFALACAAIKWYFLYPQLELITVLGVLSLSLLLRWWVWGLVFCLLVLMLSSWVGGTTQQTRWIQEVMNPFLRPLRRVIKPIGQFDFATLVCFLVLQLLLSAIELLVVLGLEL